MAAIPAKSLGTGGGLLGRVGRRAPAPPMGTAVHTAHDAIAVARTILGSELEPCTVLVLLDRRGRVSGHVEIARGWLDCALVNSQDILEHVRAARAPGFVVARCRRVEACRASDAEARVALLARMGASLVQSTMRDHVIVGRNGDHYSATLDRALGWA